MGVLATRLTGIRKTVIMDETVASVLAIKHPHESPPPRSTLEVYKKMPVFIPVDITEDVVELVARRLSGSLGHGGTESEALQVWLLKSGEDSKKLCTSVVVFYLANNIPPWATYRAFMDGRLIALDKQPGVHPVTVGETWRRLFENCVMKVMGS